MKNTRTNTIKTRIIAAVLSVITILSAASAATVSASAASTGSVAGDAAYAAGLGAIRQYVPGGQIIAGALDAICSSFMDSGPSLGDISKDISDMRSEMNRQFNDIKNQMKNYSEQIENKIVDQTVISNKGVGLDKLMTGLKNTTRQIDSINSSHLNDNEKAVEIAALIGNNTQWNNSSNLYFEYQDLMNTLSSPSFADQKNRDLFRVLSDDFKSKVMFSGEALDMSSPYVQRVMLLGLYAYSINAQCLKAAQTVSQFTDADEAVLSKTELYKYNAVKSLTNIIDSEINAVNTQMFDTESANSVMTHYINYENTSRTIFLNKGTVEKPLKSTLRVGELSDSKAVCGITQSPALSYDDIKAIADYIKSAYPKESFRGYLTTVGFDMKKVPKKSNFTVGDSKDGGYYTTYIGFGTNYKMQIPNPMHCDQISIDDNSFRIEDKPSIVLANNLCYTGQYIVGFTNA